MKKELNIPDWLKMALIVAIPIFTALFYFEHQFDLIHHQLEINDAKFWELLKKIDDVDKEMNKEYQELKLTKVDK